MARTGKKAPKLEKTRAQGVYKRNGTYVVRVWDPRTKKRTWHSNGDWTFQDAVDHRDRLRDEIRRGRRSRGGEETVRQFATRWPDDYRHNADGVERSESTVEANRTAVGAFIVEFGDRPLSGVTEKEAHDFAGRHSWRVMPLKAMYRDAVKSGVTDSDPFQGVRLRRRSQKRNGLAVVTADELELLAQCAVDELGDWGERYMAPMIRFAAWEGVRPGELYALRWSDIDFAKSRLMVREQHSARLGKITGPKYRSVREIILTPRGAEALMKVERRTPAAFDPDVIFAAPRGGQMSTRAMAFQWPKVRARFRSELGKADPARARLFKPDMRFYDLRHVCATYMLERGLPSWVVAQQLGHTDNGRLVEQTYGHPSEELAREQILRAFAEPDAAGERQAESG